MSKNIATREERDNVLSGVDFYLGKGKDAKWLGSTMEHHSELIDRLFKKSSIKTAEDFKVSVGILFNRVDDHWHIDNGWPWFWSTSSLTIDSYWFFDGQIWVERCDKYIPIIDSEKKSLYYPENTSSYEDIDYPKFERSMT